jgi:hypothetical protein
MAKKNGGMGERENLFYKNSGVFTLESLCVGAAAQWSNTARDFRFCITLKERQ